MSSSSLPGASEAVFIDGKQYRCIREGRASVLAPYQEDKSLPARKGHNNDQGSQAVFYNPIQQFNRDLSVLAILVYGEGAVAQKASRPVKKSQRGKTTRQPTNEAAATNGTDSTGILNARKRKADAVDQGFDKNGAKRTRPDDFQADEDEIEVLQLNGDSNELAKGLEVQAQEEAPKDGVDIPEAPPPRVRFSILDALSATGLRALRYAKEIPFATHVVANDVSREAVKSIELNIEHNEVGDVVHSNVADARAYMYSKVGNERSTSESYIHRFDVVDLDPYGTAAPFLDAAIQSLQDGGLLCVTCTDAGVFASNGYPEKAYALYGGIPCKGPWSHEAGLRLILNAIATAAAKYGIAVEPLLSLSIDFYARVFVRLHKVPQEVKMLAGTTMMVYNCDAGCGAWTTHLLARNQQMADKKGGTFYKHSFAQTPAQHRLCEQCNVKMHMGGPMWAGPIHNPYFVQKMLDRLSSLDPDVYGTTDRLRGMLTLALEEDLTLATSNAQANTPVSRSDSSLPNANIIPRLPPTTIDGAPFFFIPGTLAKVLHCVTPGEDPLRGAIRSLGYLVTRSHCKPGSFKTNAPWSAIWEVMREWVRQKAPIKVGAAMEGSTGWSILQRTSGTRGRFLRQVVDDLTSKLQHPRDEEFLMDILRSAMDQLEHQTPASASQLPPTSPADQSIATSKIRFDADLGRERPRGRLVRYQINPRANWGPMNRAGGS